MGGEVLVRSALVIIMHRSLTKGSLRKEQKRATKTRFTYLKLFDEILFEGLF